MSITRFRYDAAGRLAHATNNDAEIGRSYYRNGQLKTDTLRIRSVDRATIEMAKVLSHEYDLAGRETRLAEGANTTDVTYDDLGYGGLSTVTAPDGTWFTLSYDVAGRLRGKSAAPTSTSALTVRDTMEYDADNRLIKRGESRKQSGSWAALHVDSMTYDARGKLIGYHGNSPERTGRIQEATFRYSGLGALITDAITRDGLAFVPSETFRTDALGNRIWDQRPDIGQSRTKNTPLSRTHYFDADRLIAVRADFPDPLLGLEAIWPDSTRYTYDVQGNVIKEFSSQQRLDHDNPNEVDLLSKTFSRRYYGTDNTLRVVQRYAATYQENNQTAIPDRRGVFEEYRYDPLGRRVMVYSRRPNPGLCNDTALCVSSTDLFIWNGDQLHGETYRESWRPYVHGLGIDRPLKIGDILPHADFRGQYELGSYATGADFTAADYPADHRGAFLNEPVTRLPNGYASLLQDQMDGSGLMYRRNRYYDPQSGRFTQEDPIGLAGGINLYGYAGGDPLNSSDPFGLRVCFGGSRQADLIRATEGAIQADISPDADGCVSDASQVEQWRGTGEGTQLFGRFIDLVQSPRTYRLVVRGDGPIDQACADSLSSCFSRLTFTSYIDLGDVRKSYFRKGTYCRLANYGIGKVGGQFSLTSIIAHELLGHASVYGPGSPDTEEKAIQIENQYYRREGLTQRACHAVR